MTRFGSRFLGGVLALAIVAAGGLAYAVFGSGGGQHLQNTDCAGCHLGGKNAVGQQAAMLVGSQEALCGRCHPNAIKLSHPSGFQPKAKLPDAYPLDWKGDLTCSSCHDVHGSAPGLLRGTRQGKDLCFACHDAAFFKKMRDGGASLMVGHLASGVDSQAPALDVYSRQCMECHGNSGDPKLLTSIDRNGIARHVDGSVNHPVGANYQKASTFGGYRPRAVVERRLMLPNGLVSCVSCHHGYLQEHGKLVVTRAESKLCYECHDL
jgi:predicted CXXCH cytochrome family protein